MAFIAPEFAILRERTLELYNRFSTISGTYKITMTPEEADGVYKGKSPSTQELLIHRTQIEVIQAKVKTARTEQFEVLNKLVNELRQAPGKNEKECENAALFLLGALLHRYFRIIKESETQKKYIGGLFSITHARNSSLFVSIRAALQLPKNMSRGYRERDLEVLDAATIVFALEAFRDNMKKPLDNEKVPRYQKYPHLAKDDDFLSNLQELIDEHRKRDQVQESPIIAPFEAVAFIQSLTEHVTKEQTQVLDALDAWSKIWIKEHPDLSKLSLSETENPENNRLTVIEAHIKIHITAGSVRDKIIELLYTNYIKNKLDTAAINNTVFLNEMKKSLSFTSSYIVCGGYYLLLQSQGIGRLKRYLHTALGISDASVLTDQDKQIGIGFLQQFTAKYPKLELNCTFFGGVAKLQTALAQQEEALDASEVAPIKRESEVIVAAKVKRKVKAKKTVIVEEEAADEAAVSYTF